MGEQHNGSGFQLRHRRRGQDGGLDESGDKGIIAALSAFDDVTGRVRQELAEALRQASRRFGALVSDTLRLDQELADKTPSGD